MLVLESHCILRKRRGGKKNFFLRLEDVILRLSPVSSVSCLLFFFFFAFLFLKAIINPRAADARMIDNINRKMDEIWRHFHKKSN